MVENVLPFGRGRAEKVTPAGRNFFRKDIYIKKRTAVLGEITYICIFAVENGNYAIFRICYDFFAGNYTVSKGKAGL